MAKDTARHWVFSTATLITIAITTALSIAAAAVQYMQQQAAAEQAERTQRAQMEAQMRNQEAQMRAQDAAIAANAALANRAYMDETKALQERQRQSDEASYVREHGVSVQAAQARSTALVAAGEAGVSGLSVNALMDDFTRQEVDYRFQSQTQLGYEREQTAREIGGAQTKAEGRTQRMQPFQGQELVGKHIEYPSLLGAGLRVAASVGSDLSSRGRTTPQVPPAGGGGYNWGSYL